MIGWNQLRKDRMAILSIWLLALVALAGLFAPVLAPHDTKDTNILQKYAGVSLTYPLLNEISWGDVYCRGFYMAFAQRCLRPC